MAFFLVLFFTTHPFTLFLLFVHLPLQLLFLLLFATTHPFLLLLHLLFIPLLLFCVHPVHSVESHFITERKKNIMKIFCLLPLLFSVSFFLWVAFLSLWIASHLPLNSIMFNVEISFAVTFLSVLFASHVLSAFLFFLLIASLSRLLVSHGRHFLTCFSF